MNYEEIKNTVHYNDYKGYESNIYMPNEIFDELKGNIKNTPHVAFAYSYVYLITWLYRYVKHTNGIDVISNSTIKEILGYNSNTRTINYLIKKNGLLDQMGYTSTERDFPVQVAFEDGALEFLLVSELDDKSNPKYCYEFSTEKVVRDDIPLNFTIKKPVKAFEREVDENGCIEVEGTFYDIENTHCIPFEIFMYCMSNEDIGCTGFYLYAYLKHKNDLFENGYDVSLESLTFETGIAERTLDKYLGMLKSYKMIDFRHNQEFFAMGLKKEDRKANTYITNDLMEFNDTPVPFKRISIMKKKEYFDLLKKEDEEKKTVWQAQKCDISVDELPY